MLLDVYSKMLHLEDCFRTEVRLSINRRSREIAPFMSRFVPRVQPAIKISLFPRVPDALIGVDEVIAAIRGLVKPCRVEYEKLNLRSPVALVTNTSGLQVFLGLLGDKSRVTRIGLAGQRVSDVAN